MAKKFMLLDDFDGKELPEDTKPIPLTWNGTTYNLYLGNGSVKALMKALDPFIKDAEVAPTESMRVTRSRPKKRADLDAVRAWAREKGMQVADRGRVSEQILKEYDAQH